MGEIKKIVQPIYVRYLCDKCGGEMLPTGISTASIPPLYQHKCKDCGEIDSFRCTYPRIEYETEDQD